MKKLLKRLKSNKGFTMQDVIIAIVILTIFVGVISGSYLAIYKIQLQTNLNTVASLYAIQVLEYTDRISYDELSNCMEEECRQIFQIPNGISLNLEVSQYNSENTLKKVKLTISYDFSGSTETIAFEKLKVKEL